MEKNILLSPMEESLQYIQLIEDLKKHVTPIGLHGLNESQKSHMIYGIYKKLNKQILLLTYNEIEAKQTYQDLKFYLRDNLLFFPARDIVFYDVEATSEGVNEERIRTLNKLMEGEQQIVVASIESLLLKLTPSAIYNKYQATFKVGNVVDLQQVTETFVLQGYERSERVDTEGQFSIRGGIIDVFPPAAEHPIRIELFDDEVDSIRWFEVDTQKSIKKIQEVRIDPAIEIIIEAPQHKEIIEKVSQEVKTTVKKLTGEAGEKLEAKVREAIEKLENLHMFKGVQRFLPYAYEGASLMDYLQKDAVIMLDEPDRGKEKVKSHREEFTENFKTLLERGEVLPSQMDLLFTHEDLVKQLKHYNLITTSLLPKNYRDLEPKKIISLTSRPAPTFHGKVKLLVEEVKDLRHKGYKIALVTTTKEKSLRLLQLLREEEIPTEFIVQDTEELTKDKVVILQGNLHKGFEYVDTKFVILTDYEIYGVNKKKKQRTKRKDATPIKSFIDLKVGDYVVHEGHGIGKYIGIEELKVEGIKKDYLKIRYSGEDNLYLPTDQMDLIQRYIGGGEDRQPKLNKLGGTEWVKTKAKAKKAIEDMAQDLIKLYAEREQKKGYAFSPDTDWQKQFEYLFPYEETPDQLKVIEEVKRDMEGERPMDRLLCGDVGYGKTEVAIRASFKAVMNSKQVAILVPTTILAQQHYNNFKERFSGFPITVEMISRFRSAAQQKQTLESLRTGNVDIVIGTHRILSKDIQFKDLGLLVVDEEQRFGVKHKEALKQLRKSVDVLTLTATPIPRTLHMSMIGVRDMSVIEDPPEERYPVQTYVAAQNESLVVDALIREISRGGQVYYVYNRVQGINQVAAKLTTLVPQARVAVAHGQMSEKQLEKLMMEYYHGEYDVLVCTTIIETGLDIPNVNTIIIQDADRLGLSQLYQLRGRVGRSNRQGYAYLLYEKDKILSEVAEKRLKAIKEFTEFGSGFKIAMRDLEIRGAGNLLGSEQHGHMASIGYDLYVKLLEEAVAELKGEKVEKYEDTMMELNVDAYISEKYISNQSHKIEIYKKIASIRNQEDLYAIEDEIEDRFGDIPMSVRNLLMISYMKALAKNLKVQSISQKGKVIRIQFKDANTLRPEYLADVMQQYKWKVNIHAGAQPHIEYKVQVLDQYRVLTELADIIEKISGLKKKAS